MKHINNTGKGIKVPVKDFNPRLPVSWTTFNPGEVKELPQHAHKGASLLGLEVVHEKVEEVSKKPKKAKKVKARKSSIGKKKVETKQIK